MKRSLFFFLPFLVAYLQTFWWMWGTWQFREGYYEHAPFVVAVAAFVIYQRRSVLGSLPLRTDARGYWLLAPGLLLHLVGSALTVDSLSALSLALSVPGVVWVALGWPRTRALLPVLGLILFIIPMPLFVTGRVVFELKEFAVTLGVALTNLTGLGVERARENLTVPGAEAPLFVADACGGLRSLLSLTTLGYALAFLMGDQRGPRRWVLLVIAGPLAVAMNIVRIAGLCWMAHLFSSELAAGTGHDVLNGLIWLVDLGVLILVDHLFSRRRRPPATKVSTEAPA